MRDILTFLAAVLILILAAALIAPPFIPWEAQRETIDRALSRAAGVEARTEGAIKVRLLPSPRVQAERLTLGNGAEAPSLSARFVKAEIALTPLLRGEVRFTEARIGRAEVRIPTRDGAWLLPSPEGVGAWRNWAFENVAVAQLLVTTVQSTTGRTDQFYAENVQIEGQRLTGPWRVEGTIANVPFRLVTGELTADRTLQVKLAGGGDIHPRFDVDATLALAANAATPGVSGSAKVLFGPPAQIAAAGVPIPMVIQTTFKTAGGRIELDPLTFEAGEGSAAIRLAGTGAVQIDDPRMSLKLDGRRIDLDALLLSSGSEALKERLGLGSIPLLPIPVDLDLSLGSIGLSQDELTNVVLRASIAQERVAIDRFELTAPGQTRIALRGETDATLLSGASGRVAVTSAAVDRFLRYLGKLGLGASFPATALKDQPLEASADFAVAAPVASFRNMRVKLGESAVTGSARYAAPGERTRGRLDAQLVVQGFDLAQLPQLNSIFEATENLDVGFILDARNVRHGSRGGAGRVSARIVSDGATLVVDSLDIADLAGANARVSGRIAPDGSGRITGTVTAQRAAPLVDLLGSVWIGGVSKLVPPFLREGALDLNVTAERASAGPQGSPRLRTIVKGRAAGGDFAADVLTVDGVTQTLSVRLATDNTGRWVDRPNLSVLRRPSVLDLTGVRVASSRFNLTVAGDLGGVRIATTRPFALGAEEDVVDSGEADVSTDDLTPLLVLLGEGARVDGPVPARMRVTLGRERDASLVTAQGRIAGGAVDARVAVRSRSDVRGSASLDRLSMPWLTAAFALNAAPDPRASWSTSRFGQRDKLIQGGQISFKVRELLLGRELRGGDATFTVALTPQSLAIQDLKAGLAGGRIAGHLLINRQGTQASFSGEGTIDNAFLQALGGASPFEARVSGTLKFGASGESLAAIVSNLSGAGDVRLVDLRIPNADPAAIARALPRALAESDPLAARRLEAIMAEELSRGPLRAGVSAPASMVGGVLRLSPVVADAGAALWQGTVGFDLQALVLDARGTLTSRASPKGWTGAAPYFVLAWRGPLANPSREIDVGPLINGLAAIVLQRELEKIEAFEAEANERARLNARRDMDRQRERDRIAAAEAARREAEEAARRAAAEEAARRAAEEAARRAAEEAARQARIREQQAAEEAVRQARLREEAERQARLREQQEAERQARLRAEAERQARLREEAERQARLREQQEAERRARLREQFERALSEGQAASREPSPPALPPPIDIRPAPQIGRPPLGPGG